MAIDDIKDITVTKYAQTHSLSECIFHYPPIKWSDVLKTKATLTKTYGISKLIYDAVSYLPNTLLVKPIVNKVEWYRDNLPDNKLRAAIESSLYLFTLLVFVSGNPISAAMGSVALAGTNSLVHSFSMPFIKRFVLSKDNQDKMSPAIRIATLIAVGIVTSIAFSFLAIYFPPLAIFGEINITFSVGLLLISEGLRIAYKILNEKVVHMDHSSKHAEAALMG